MASVAEVLHGSGRAAYDRGLSVRPAQEEKRRQILRAAVRVFAVKGYHACRVADVAKEAGVAYGLVYHYFGSKEELLETIFREAWHDLLERANEIAASGTPAAEQLRAVAAIVLRSWKGDPDLMRVLVREVARSPHMQKEIDEIRSAFDTLTLIVERGQQAGELRDDLDPRLVAYIFYGALEELVTGWVLESLPGSDADVARAEEHVSAIVAGGLAAQKRAR